MCQNCLGKFPSTLLGHLPALYQGAAPPSLSFPRVINSLPDKAQATGTAGNMGCMSSKLGEEPTDFLPAAEQTGHDESSCFWHSHSQGPEHKGTRVLQLGLQHLWHSPALPEPLGSTEAVCSCNPPREGAEAPQLCHYYSILSPPAQLSAAFPGLQELATQLCLQQLQGGLTPPARLTPALPLHSQPCKK